MLQILTAHPEEDVKALLPPRQLFLLIPGGWVNLQQQDAIGDGDLGLTTLSS